MNGFLEDCIILHSLQHCVRDPVFPASVQALRCPCVLSYHSNGCAVISVVFIRISLMADDVGHHLLCLSSNLGGVFTAISFHVFFPISFLIGLFLSFYFEF